MYQFSFRQLSQKYSICVYNLPSQVISVEFYLIPDGKTDMLELLMRIGYEIMIETYLEPFTVLTKYKHELGFGGLKFEIAIRGKPIKVFRTIIRCSDA